MVDTDIEQQARTDPLLRHMIKHGVPLTRQNYVGMAYGPGEPDEWTAEHEAMLPRCFQQDPLPADKHG